MTALPALIARLEAAPEGSRELDAEIAAAIGCTRAARLPPYNTPYLVRHPNGRTIELPHYTTSLDAAMTLVPEDWQFLELRFAMMSEDGPEGYGCMLKPKHDIVIAFTGFSRRKWPRTPALALCTAALRARGET